MLQIEFEDYNIMDRSETEKTANDCHKLCSLFLKEQELLFKNKLKTQAEEIANLKSAIVQNQYRLSQLETLLYNA